MSKLIIMCGESGSGKSTFASQLKLAINSEGKPCITLSTDNYWIRPDGHYSFNARELEQAHQWNFDKFKMAIEDEDFNRSDCTIVLDNTNLRFSEFERYARLAVEKGWEVKIVPMPVLEEKELFHRNRHGVPLETIRRQLSRRESIEEMVAKLAALKA